MLKFLAASVAGAATVLAFSPFGLFPLGILGPAVLFALWLDASPRNAFFTGLFYGVGLFGLGVSWVYVSLHVYGNMPVPLAVVTVFLFVLILSAYPAVVGLVQALIPASVVFRACLLVPVVWTLFEWVRGWLFTGFPWLSLGYGQIDSPLSNIAQWLGTLGVSWASVATAGILVALVFVSGYLRRLLLIAAVCSLWGVGWLADQWSWVSPLGSPLRVAIVQGNVALDKKWEPSSKQAILQEYLRLSESERRKHLIVWPEAALPFYLDQLPNEFWDTVIQHPADFVIGALERRTEDGTVHSYNSVLAVSEKHVLYRKQHLVPFGEFLPLPFLLNWIIDYLEIPMSDFSAWQAPQSAIEVAGTKVGISICYEDAFLEEVRRTLPEAALLINVSEDSWFGDSFAPHQRLDMARMRSLENGRPMVRAANTGVSAVIDQNGVIVARTPQFIRVVLRGEVQPMQGVTPFVRYGSWPVIIACSIILLICIVLGLVRRSR